MKTYPIVSETFYGSYGAPDVPPKYSSVPYIEKSSSGGRNPNYRDMIRSRSNATTDWDASIVNIASNPYVVRCTAELNGMAYAEGGSTMAFSDFSKVVVPADLGRLAYAKAYSQFNSRARSALVDFAGPTFAAELRDTIRMLRNPAQGLVALCKAYARAVKGAEQLYKGKDLSQHLSSLWLQYAYGIRPLVNDVQDAMEAYRKLSQGGKTIRIGGSGSYTRESEKNFTNTFGGNIMVRGTRNESFTSSVRIRAGFYRQGVGPDLNRVDQLNAALSSLGLSHGREYVAAGYELIPFSFVADYVSNISDVLLSGYETSGHMVYASVTSKHTGRREIATSSFTTMPGSWRPMLSGGRSMSSREDISLSRRGTIDAPSLTFKLPSSRQGVNLAALMNSLRPGKLFS